MFAFLNNATSITNLNFKNQIKPFATIRNGKKKEINNLIRKKKSAAQMVYQENFNEISKKIFLTWIVFQPIIALAVPESKPEIRIIDDSANLTKSSISYIDKNIQKINDLNGSQIYFISIRSLPFEQSAPEYAKEIFEKWSLNQKDVVVVLVNKIAKAGIYYGNDVKGLTPENTTSIGEETYTFKAKEEQYSSAAIDVSNRLVSILSNKGDPGAPVSNREDNSSKFKSAKATEQKRSKYVAIIIVLLIIAFVVPMVQFFYYVKDE